MTPFNKSAVEILIAQCLEDDERMTPGPWARTRDNGVYAGKPRQCIGSMYDSEGIVRTRNNLRQLAEQLAGAVAEIERAQQGKADEHFNLLEAQDVIAKTHDVLSTAKVPPCDGDENEYHLDQRVQWLVDHHRRVQEHANRVDQIEMDQAAELGDAKQELERLKVGQWAADIRLAAKFARALPQEDEVDSVMSLLNWLRMNHDQDSSAREWLERVVAIAIASTTRKPLP